MPCYYPLHGYQCQQTGKVFMRPTRDCRNLTVACGQCDGCRFERSRQWAVRCMHEAKLYKNNCFITLTYSPENVPEGRSLVKSDFQQFMKRLRKRFSGLQLVPLGASGMPRRNPYPIRYYMCGEYGDKLGRPHFHALLFNFDFDDKKFWKTTASGQKLYRSAKLEELWTHGFSSVGDVNFQSAAYVARYVQKKVTGDLAEEHYQYFDEETGVIYDRLPEYNDMSRDGGIGLAWLNKYHGDVYPNDYVVVNGKETRPPKYYDRKYTEMSASMCDVQSRKHLSEEMDAIKHERYLDSLNYVDDNSPERLEVKRQVFLARTKSLKRTLT